MKYKVGDKVRVREDLINNQEYGGEVFVSYMKKYKGKEFGIRNAWDGGYKLHNINDFVFTDEMLEEPAHKEENFDDIIKEIEDYQERIKVLFKRLEQELKNK